MKRIILFALAGLAALLIIGGSYLYRQQNDGEPEGTIALLSDEASPSPLPTGLLQQPRAVPFPGTVTAVIPHEGFPLTQSHAALPCNACHDNDVFTGMGTACVDCHLTDDVHNGANGRDCATCHTPTQWQDATFDHTLIGNRDCVECHSPPANHYPGTCSSCHLDTTNFFNVTFDHSSIGSTDCAACHSPPPNHYPGTCSSCHLDTTNFSNAIFDHSFIGSTDCAACHSPPPNHYPGTCSSCHLDTSNFFNASFNHSVIGSTDCAACHSPPPNHYPGTCSSCHLDTSNFRNASFSHTFPLNHENANGVCSTCHPGNNTTTYTCTACHDQNEMIEEHEDEDIFDIANCFACHADGEEPDDD